MLMLKIIVTNQKTMITQFCSFPQFCGVSVFSSYLFYSLWGLVFTQCFYQAEKHCSALDWEKKRCTFFWMTSANTMVTEGWPHKLPTRRVIKAQNSPAFSVQTISSHKWNFLSLLQQFRSDKALDRHTHPKQAFPRFSGLPGWRVTSPERSDVCLDAWKKSTVTPAPF